MGWLALLVLSALVLGAAFALTQTIFGVRDRVANIVGTMIAAHVIIIGALYGLGVSGLLSRGSVFLVVSLPCVLIIALWLRSKRARWPFRGVAAEVVRAFKSEPIPLFVAALVALALFLWVLFAVFFSPPRGNSDAYFYHEPLVAFAIQNHGFAVEPLTAKLQRINGMPRFCHIMQLWFALFTGRTLVELPNVLSHVLAVFSLYGLVRRVGCERPVAMVLGVSFTLTPGILRLTDVIMLDTHTAALTIAAVYLVSHHRKSAAAILFAAFSVALVTGTKYHLAPVAAALSAVLGLRMLFAIKSRGALRTLALVLGAAGIVLVGMAATYLRNYLLFENPIYPAGLKIASLDIDWRATSGMRDAWRAGKDVSRDLVYDKFFAAPFSVKPWYNPSARVEDYGLFSAYVAMPLAFVVGCLTPMVLSVRRVARLPFTHRELALATSVLVAAAAAYTFPSIIRGRYHLPVVFVWTVCVAWLISLSFFKRHAATFAFVAQALMLVSLIFCARIGWITKPGPVFARVPLSMDEREFVQRYLVRPHESFARKQLEGMPAGTRVGFDEAKLLGVLWNNDYSNTVVMMGKKRLLDRADELKLDWIYLHRGKLERRAAGDPRLKDWVDMGPVLTGRKGVPPGRVYRRGPK